MGSRALRDDRLHVGHVDHGRAVLSRRVTTWVYVDETKRAGYVLAAVAVPDPVAVRKVIRALVQPGNRRLHMVDERPRNRPTLVATLAATAVTASIYDAGRNYSTDHQARSASSPLSSRT